MKIVVHTELPGRFREILAGHDLEVAPADLATALGRAEALLCLLSLPVNAALLGGASKLRIVANYAVGLDNIDLSAASARGVLVTHTPGVLTDSTADLTILLMLAACRRLAEADRLIRSGRWRGWEPTQLLGLELRGATLGLIGYGRIGQAVAERARAFGMNVIHAGRGAAIDALLRQSDVVSLHTPLTVETRHLIDAAALAKMKRGAVLVNTARGPIVDEAALCDALEAGHLGGVGLDVFEREPAVDARLLAHPRAVIVPHIGSATVAARTRMADTAAQSIADFFAGRRPAHMANPEVFR